MRRPTIPGVRLAVNLLVAILSLDACSGPPPAQQFTLRIGFFRTEDISHFSSLPMAANDFADPEHPGSAVMVSPSIQRWRDLQGKQIAINAVNSITTAAVKGRLEEEGVKGYRLVEIPFPNMGLAVAGGKVAAADMNETYLTQPLLRGDDKLLGWVVGGPPFTRAQASLISSRSSCGVESPEKPNDEKASHT